MHKLPCLVFNRNAELLHICRLPETEIDNLFINALKHNDKRVFKRFCSAKFDPNRSDFKLFHLSDGSKYSFAFLEKNKLKGDTMNFVYLAEDVSGFYPLMSPTSQHYREITGRFIYEMLSLSHMEKDEVPFLTPSAFTALESIPHLRDELLANPRKPEYCNLRLVTESMIKQIKTVPTLRKTKITFSCGSSGEDNSAGIIEFAIPAYIYLFVSLIHIFHALSLDHSINICIDFNSAHGSVTFSAKISKYRQSDVNVTSIAELAEFLPGINSIAKIAAFVAFDANFDTVVSYNSATRTLSTSVILGCKSEAIPQFHYRDPYSNIPEIFREFAQFMQTLLDSAS